MRAVKTKNHYNKDGGGDDEGLGVGFFRKAFHFVFDCLFSTSMHALHSSKHECESSFIFVRHAMVMMMMTAVDVDELASFTQYTCFLLRVVANPTKGTPGKKYIYGLNYYVLFIPPSTQTQNRHSTHYQAPRHHHHLHQVCD